MQQRIESLQLDALDIGAIAVASALGALPAAFLTKRIGQRVPVGKAIICGLGLSYVLMLTVPAVAPLVGEATIIMVLLTISRAMRTFAFTVSNVQQWTLRQITTPKRLLARVSTTFGLTIGTAEIIGAAGSGFVVATLDPTTSMVAFAGLAVACLLPMCATPLWNLRTLPDHERD